MATLKTCFKCNAEKPLAEFYRHPAMGDGHLGKCKDCTKRDVKETRAANLDHYREYDRARASLPHRKEMAEKIFARWKQSFPERRAAHNKLAAALKKGVVERLPCWVCGGKAEAHHPDYSSPLNVVWLCAGHHKQLHAEAQKLVNGNF